MRTEKDTNADALNMVLIASFISFYFSIERSENVSLTLTNLFNNCCNIHIILYQSEFLIELFNHYFFMVLQMGY